MMRYAALKNILILLIDRLEDSENVKYINVTLRASKLQFLKVRPGWGLNPGLPHRET